MVTVYQFYAKIYSAIACSQKISFLEKSLYLFARSLDKAGSGCVALDLPMLARTINRSISTIKNNLRSCVKHGLFYCCHWSGATVKIWYKSLPKVCHALGIEKLGAIYELNAKDFDTIRTQNIRQAIAQKQKHSQFLATKEADETKTTKPISPEKILNASSGIRTGAKGIVELRGHRLYVGSGFKAYGASQRLISNLTNRTPQTIRKHLKSVKNLKPVRSLQICQNQENIDIESGSDRYFWVDKELGKTNYLRYKGKIYKTLPNIYDLDGLALVPQKRLRKRISSYLKKMEA